MSNATQEFLTAMELLNETLVQLTPKRNYYSWSNKPPATPEKRGNLPSLTQPDQVMSLQTLLKEHVRESANSVLPTYTVADNADLTEVHFNNTTNLFRASKMDIIEASREYMHQTKLIRDKVEQQEAERKAKAAADAQAKLEAEIEAKVRAKILAETPK